MLHKSNFRFWLGVLLFNALFLSNLLEYHYKSYIFSKTGFFGYTFWFCLMQYGSNSSHFVVIDLKGIQFSKMTRNNGHYVIQGHFSSAISVPEESPCATFMSK